MAAPRGLGDTDPLAKRRRVPSTIPTSADLAAAGSADSTAADEADDGPPTRPERRRTTGKTTKAIPGNKRQVTAYIAADVVDDARNAVLALMANPAGHRTLSALIEEGIAREVQRLRDELHNGKPFPQRQVELQAGRPAGG